MHRDTITTTFHPQQRVSFSTPAGGYTLDHLSTLEAAIKHARRKLTEEPLEVVTPDPDLDEAFAVQCERLAAPT